MSLLSSFKTMWLIPRTLRSYSWRDHMLTTRLVDRQISPTIDSSSAGICISITSRSWMFQRFVDWIPRSSLWWVHDWCVRKEKERLTAAINRFTPLDSPLVNVSLSFIISISRSILLSIERLSAILLRVSCLIVILCPVWLLPSRLLRLTPRGICWTPVMTFHSISLRFSSRLSIILSFDQSTVSSSAIFFH